MHHTFKSQETLQTLSNDMHLSFAMIVLQAMACAISGVLQPVRNEFSVEGIQVDLHLWETFYS